jgi:hypothetical protein
MIYKFEHVWFWYWWWWWLRLWLTVWVIIYVELECVNDNYDDKVMIIINDPDYSIILLNCILFYYS